MKDPFESPSLESGGFVYMLDRARRRDLGGLLVAAADYRDAFTNLTRPYLRSGVLGGLRIVIVVF